MATLSDVHIVFKRQIPAVTVSQGKIETANGLTCFAYAAIRNRLTVTFFYFEKRAITESVQITRLRTPDLIFGPSYTP